MSAKRQATTDLNHDNWDQDDPSDHEEMGNFKTASKDVLEKRVMRTAKRRSVALGDEAKKNVFSGFGGFNKTQPSSFDFLSKLTNGTNKSSTTKSDTTVSTTIFKNTSGNGLFGTPSTTKPIFGITSTQASPIFGSPTTINVSSVFAAAKSDSTVHDSPFKSQITSSISNSNGTSIKTVNTISGTSVSQGSSTILGLPASGNSKVPLLTSPSNSTLLTAKPVSSTTTLQTKSESPFTSTSKKDSEVNAENKEAEKKLSYYSKLRGLNESVSAWITKHVDQTPLCILTPIFKDYEKYLKDIQDEYQNNDDKPSDMDNKITKNSQDESIGVNKSSPLTSKSSVFSLGAGIKSTTTTTESPTKPSFVLGTTSSNTAMSSSLFSSTIGINKTSPLSLKSTGFSFGSDSKSTTATENPSKPSFGSGKTTNNTGSTSSSLFSSAVNTNGSAPFSFGIGKPFSFNSNIQTTNTEASKETNENEDKDDDSPPKVEFKQVVEENSIYDKRCKIFVKKEDNFVDKGVGTLYIKKIEETGKYQLLVRANTNLGNVLLNLILSSVVPIQRMGKNNVMMVCIPTPDAKPPPVPILIRVKTSEEADELLETLDKYKT
ncbi:nuclear pore complex protein Nup50 [Achroia grisella]|uniref:nuclear pore complex protein Nup50 n=1 Tax=Achroia grisella TaxID=688607 RepID=UPI0027D2BA2C|nr:nuclear pore complex protein Nup50 [Achroia grisella]XP_059061925.1 nuclear pore complex protein Nup50 [Achroia grisella]